MSGTPPAPEPVAQPLEVDALAVVHTVHPDAVTPILPWLWHGRMA